MGLFSKIKDAAFTQLQPSLDSDQVVFVREYTNMKRFNKTRRLHITVYGDKIATKNTTTLLNNEHVCDCVDRQVTLSGFEFDGGSGIRVAVDGKHIGVVWNHEADPVYEAAWNGDIEGVFVRIEWGLDDRPEAKLFVRLAE